MLATSLPRLLGPRFRESVRSVGPAPLVRTAPGIRTRVEVAGIVPTLERPTSPHLVMLPTLNEEEGIRATLDEILIVTGFEDDRAPPVLVVDGGSTDATVRIARE